MSFVNFFVRSIRGWLPEEPKMPKSKLRRTLPPIAVLVAATTIVSLFYPSLFVSTPTAALVPPPAIVPSAPNSSFVELGGVVDKPEGFILVLSDGNYISSTNLALKYFLTERSGGDCTVRLAVECTGFSKEISVDGSIVNGNLVIDSRQSLFLINPDLAKNQEIVLTETGNWRLDATVDSTPGKVPTAIDPYGVTAVRVSSQISRTEKGWPLRLNVGYDPNTGLLMLSSCSLSDVLLEKVGIDLLIGGLRLVSYSENLQLEVANRPPPGMMPAFLTILYLLLFSSPVIVPVAVVAVYLVRRRRKRRQAGAHSVLEYPDNFGQSCEVGD